MRLGDGLIVTKGPTDSTRRHAARLQELIRRSLAYREEGDRDGAEAHLAAARELAEGVPPLRHSVLDIEAIWVQTLAHFRDLPAARERLQDAARQAALAGDEPRALRFALQRLALDQQDRPPEQTLAELTPLAEAWEALGQPEQAAVLHLHRAAMLARMGELRLGIAVATTALDQLQPEPQSVEFADGLLLCTALYGSLGDLTAAKQTLRRLDGARVTRRQAQRTLLAAARHAWLSGTDAGLGLLESAPDKLTEDREVQLATQRFRALIAIWEGSADAPALVERAALHVLEPPERLEHALLVCEAALWGCAPRDQPDLADWSQTVAARAWEAAEALPDPLARAATALETCALSMRYGRPISRFALLKQTQDLQTRGALELALATEALAELADGGSAKSQISQLDALGLHRRSAWLERLETSRPD